MVVSLPCTVLNFSTCITTKSPYRYGDAEPPVEPGPHAERQKEEKKSQEEEWEEWEEWGEGERRCYLLGQEHDSWEVQERKAREWPIRVQTEDEEEIPALTQGSDSG